MSKMSSSPTSWRRFMLQGPTMATSYTATFYAPHSVDIDAITYDLAAAVAAVDGSMSNWSLASDISRLNRAQPGAWVDLPKALVVVLEAALAIGRASGGAFDIGVGALVAAWGFGPPIRQPDPAAIAALTSKPQPPTASVLEVDAQGSRARLTAPLSLDLCGIAKGFGVDELARCLDAHGIDNYLVGIDGEMRAQGAKPDGPWSVGLASPAGHDAGPFGVIDLVDAALATSGTLNNRVAIGDRHFAHVMNPVLARPLGGPTASVTVVADSCMVADAWATALLVLGAEAGIDLARAKGLSALFIACDGAAFTEHGSGVFATRVLNQPLGEGT